MPPGRTYRYWRGEAPLFPFGHGLSYVQWRLSDAAIGAAGNGSSSGGGSGTGSDGADLEGEAVALEAAITVTNEGSIGGASSSSGGSGSGNMTASTSVLLFMRLVGDADAGGGSGGSGNAAAGELPLATVSGSGCSWAANGTDVVMQLVSYARTGPLAPGASQRLSFRLRLAPSDGAYGGSGNNSSSSSSSWVDGQSSWAGFGDPEPPCGVYALRFGADQPDAALVLLD